MKAAVSVFEKLLVSIIIFVFCIVVLVQIFVNNDVLSTIKANEDGTPVSMEQSSVYSPKGSLEFSLSRSNGVFLLLNGEEVNLAELKANQAFKLTVEDGNVLEVRNTTEEPVVFHLIGTPDEMTHPNQESRIECKKGITYLFKVKLEKIS